MNNVALTHFRSRSDQATLAPLSDFSHDSPSAADGTRRLTERSRQQKAFWQYAKDKANNVLTLLGIMPPTAQLSPISAVMQHTKKRFEPDAK
ncbi:hypothetical protein Tcan_07123 [Toxocara canis]|uniref:Uncharacterized protein n=1 Tax=Toxocara canis TaxID=6265 RepID=A0A0B2V9W1_TOXCA|nr:hypothetical protein Tcan_07123 [Toxocara canis]